VKKLIHDKLMAALLILATMVTVIMVFLGYRYEAGLNADIEDEKNEEYGTVCVTYSAYIEDVITISSEDVDRQAAYNNFSIPPIEGNLIYMDYCNFRFDNSFDVACADIYMQYSEQPLEELASGRYPTVAEIENGEKLIVIGKAWLPFVTYAGEDMYIGINSRNYKVTGIFEGDILGEDDGRIYMFYNSLDEEEKMDMIAFMHWGNCGFLYRSKAVTEGVDVVLDSWLRQLFPDKSSSVLNAQEEEEGGVPGVTEMIYEISKYMAVLIYVFGIISCFSVARIWAKRRTSELMVRMAFGESKLRMGIGFCLKLAAVQLFGVMLAGGIMLTVFYLEHIPLSIFLSNINGLFIQIVLAFAATAVLPLIRLKRLNPAQGLQKCR